MQLLTCIIGTHLLLPGLVRSNWVVDVLAVLGFLFRAGIFFFPWPRLPLGCSPLESPPAPPLSSDPAQVPLLGFLLFLLALMAYLEKFRWTVGRRA